MAPWKLLVCGLCLVIASEGAAQDPIDSGSLIVGGHARIAGFRDIGNDQREFGFELLPHVGVFVVRGLAVTLNARLGWSSREGSGSAFTWGLGPGVIYYFAKARQFYPYLTVRTLGVWTDFRPSDDLPDLISIDDTEWTWVAGIGGSLFVARHVALNAELFYSRFVVTSDIRLTEGIQKQRNSSEQYGLLFGVRAFVF